MNILKAAYLVSTANIHFPFLYVTELFIFPPIYLPFQKILLWIVRIVDQILWNSQLCKTLQRNLRITIKPAILQSIFESIEIFCFCRSKCIELSTQNLLEFQKAFQLEKWEHGINGLLLVYHLEASRKPLLSTFVIYLFCRKLNEIKKRTAVKVVTWHFWGKEWKDFLGSEYNREAVKSSCLLGLVYFELLMITLTWTMFNKTYRFWILFSLPNFSKISVTS